MDLGQRIRKLREEADLSQKELAQKLKLSNVTLSQYENGVRRPDIETLKIIANFFGVSSDYLIGMSGHRDPIDKRENDDVLNGFPEGVQILRRANRELTPEAKARMIEIANIFIDSVKREDGGNHE